MTIQSLVSDLTEKANNVALNGFDNQIAKLSIKEMSFFVKLNNLGVTGEDALSLVYEASYIK